MKKNKAFRIKTTCDEDGDWSVYSAQSAGRAKTLCMYRLRDLWPKASYAWITSCRRAPEYDLLALEDSGCIAWKSGLERYERNHEPSHWREKTEVKG